MKKNLLLVAVMLVTSGVLGVALSQSEQAVVDYSKILGKKRIDVEKIIGQSHKTERDRDVYADLKGLSRLNKSYESDPKVIWCDYQINGYIVSIAYYDNNWNLYKSSEEKFYRDRAYRIEINFKKSQSKEYLLKAIGFNNLDNLLKKHPGRQWVGNSWVWNSIFGESNSLIETYPYGFGGWNKTITIIGPSGSSVSVIIGGDVNKL